MALKRSGRLKTACGVLWVVTFLSCGHLAEDYFTISNFNLGQDRSVVISAASEWELSQPFFYEVRVGSEIVVSKSRICNGRVSSGVEFGTLVAEGGNTVGIFMKKYPEEILAVHNFSENFTWPGHIKGRSETEKTVLRAASIDLLQKEHPDMQLKTGNPRCR